MNNEETIVSLLKSELFLNIKNLPRSLNSLTICIFSVFLDFSKGPASLDFEEICRWAFNTFSYKNIALNESVGEKNFLH